MTCENWFTVCAASCTERAFLCFHENVCYFTVFFSRNNSDRTCNLRPTYSAFTIDTPLATSYDNLNINVLLNHSKTIVDFCFFFCEKYSPDPRFLCVMLFHCVIPWKLWFMTLVKRTLNILKNTWILYLSLIWSIDLNFKWNRKFSSVCYTQ